MKTAFFTVTDPAAQRETLCRAAQTLRAGGLVVFPTETVYGLGADATNADAARAVYAAKGRPSDNPLIIHVAHPEDAEPYAVTSDTYYQLADAFMPGPLTVILPRKDTVPLSVTGGLDTVAVRCPSHPVAHALLLETGVPVAAPSANLSGHPSPTTAAHALADLDGRVDMILDGGECRFGVESTIVALYGTAGTLLRPGAVTVEQLRTVLSHVEIAPAVAGMLGKDERPLSPGMKYKHYAPRAALALVDGTSERVAAYLTERSREEGVGILCYEEERVLFAEGTPLFVLGPEADAAAQAHRLFAALREADQNPAITRLYAHLPPKDGMGLALYNRLIRAAGHTIVKV